MKIYVRIVSALVTFILLVAAGGCGGGGGGSTIVPTLVSIAVTPDTKTITSGASQYFTATGTYSDNSTKDLTNSATWSSSDPSVAAITSPGTATGAAAGSTTITAVFGTISGAGALTVQQPTLVSIAVTPATPSKAVGSTQQFTATGTYSDNSTTDLTSSVTWSSSSTSVATIAAGGLATGVASGTATITATSGTITGTATLSVTKTGAVTITW